MVLAFGSCSTTEKSKNTKSEYDGVTNDAFIAPPVRNFTDEDDFLDEGLGDESNVLFAESIEKVNASELDDFDGVDHPLVKGLVACYQGKYKEADLIFDQNLKAYRKNPIYWTQIANCFLKKDNKRKALLYYNKAKELRKSYAPPINNIGVILERKDQPQKALLAYEEAMRIASFSLTPLFNSAGLFVRFGLVHEAEALLKSLIDLEKDDIDTISSLAYMEMIKGDYNQSLTYYNMMSRSDRSNNPKIAVNYAYALYLFGNKKRAKSVINNIKYEKNDDLSNYILQIKKLL
jgi:tetratricopeptide (TPR) repeat protein